MTEQIIVLNDAQKRSIKEDLAQAVKLKDQILSLTEQFNQLCKDADETYPIEKGTFKEHAENISKGKLDSLLDKQRAKIDSHEILKGL